MAEVLGFRDRGPGARLALAAALLLLALAHGCGEPAFAQHVKVGVAAGGGGGGGDGAPTNAQYWLGAENSGLSAEIVVTDIEDLEDAIGGYDFSAASNLTGDIPAAAMSANWGSAGGQSTIQHSTDTALSVQAGAAQSSDLQTWRNAGGTLLFAVTPAGDLRSNLAHHVWSGASALSFDFTTYYGASTLAGSRASAGNGFNVGSGFQYLFSSTSGANGSPDVGLARAAAGFVKITNGSTGNGKIYANNLALQDPTATTGDTLVRIWGGVAESGNLQVWGGEDEVVDASVNAAGDADFASLSLAGVGPANYALVGNGTSFVSTRQTISLTIPVFDPSVAVTTGDGKRYIPVPALPSGTWVVTGVTGRVFTPGTTGATTVQLYKCDAVGAAAQCSSTGGDVLSTLTSIASGDANGTAGTVDTTGTTEEVATGQVFRVDVDSVSSTAPEGLWLDITIAAATP